MIVADKLMSPLNKADYECVSPCERVTLLKHVKK